MLPLALFAKSKFERKVDISLLRFASFPSLNSKWTGVASHHPGFCRGFEDPGCLILTIARCLSKITH